MKNLFKFAAITALALGFAGSAFAKDMTFTGEAKCAKCALKKSKECQNVIEVKDGDKKVVYYLKGDASDKFHPTVCKEAKEVTLKGEVSEVDGKKWITVSEIKTTK